MNEEVVKYNALVDLVYGNFKFNYYPSELFVSETLDIIGSADPEQLDCVIYDLSIIANMLTNDDIFNKSYLEVLFMFLTHDEDTNEIDGIIEELDSAVFESLVDKTRINNTDKFKDPNKIKFILKTVNSMIHRENRCPLAVGWLNTSSIAKLKNYNLGVVYV